MQFVHRHDILTKPGPASRILVEGTSYHRVSSPARLAYKNVYRSLLKNVVAADSKSTTGNDGAPNRVIDDESRN